MAIDIYGTLGPACNSEDVLVQLIKEGMSGIRLNLSHVSLENAAAQVENLHRAAEKCGADIKLLIDMQGPELRVGNMEVPMELETGAEVLVGEGGIPVPAVVLPWLKEGQELLLDDGKLLIVMLDERRARVIRGGTLRGRKSIALPGADIYPPTLTEADLENISHAAEFGVTGLMQPFVRGREDLIAVRRALENAGCAHIRLMAKIENMRGVENIDELIEYCDEIIIARGDLGNAMPLWELPAVQKRIAAKCRAAGRDFMVVTQMLSSMEQNPVPTRAEVSDIFNAVLDGASSVMVTGETAVGKYPAEVIKYLKNCAESAMKYMEY